MVDQVGGRNVRFASQNEVREFNQDSVPFHLYPVNPQQQTQSSIAPAKGKCRCCSPLFAAIKKIFVGIYDILSKCIPFLPKRKEPVQAQSVPNTNGGMKAVVDSHRAETRDKIKAATEAKIKEIQGNPDYQKDPVGYLKELRTERRKLVDTSEPLDLVTWCAIYELEELNGIGASSAAPAPTQFCMVSLPAAPPPSEEAKRAELEEGVKYELEKLQRNPKYTTDPKGYVQELLNEKEEEVRNCRVLDRSWTLAIDRLRKLHNV